MTSTKPPGGMYPEPPPPYSSAPPPAGFAPPPPGMSAHPPPPGGVPVFPMAGYPPRQGPSVVVGASPAGQVTSVTVVNVAQWGPYPMQVTCPHCSAQVMTETNTAPGLLTWLLSGTLLFLGCWLGCCLIPCCIPECQDIEHRCPNCKHHLGLYRRI